MEKCGFTHRNLSALLGYLLASVFILSSMEKIVFPALFARIVYNYHILPGRLINLAALYLPWLELVVGLALISRYFRRVGIILSTLLISIFSLAVLSTLWRGINLNCGCFSVTSLLPSSPQLVLIRNVFLLVGIFFAERLLAGQITE